MKLKECWQILSIMVPEDCLLIVHTVLYLKKVNWSNIVTKCPLHPIRNFEFFWFFQEYWQFFYIQVPEECLSNCPCCTVPEEGKLIKYSHQVSPSKRNFEFFWGFNSVNIFFLFWFLKSVYWLSSVSCTQKVLIDCLVCVVSDVCWLIIWWCCAMKLKIVNIFFCSFSWTVFTDCPVWVTCKEQKRIVWFVLKGYSLIHWWYCAMKLKECLQILSIMVPEECLLIGHTVLYLNKVNWSNIITKCPLHRRRNFEFFWFFQE